MIVKTIKTIFMALVVYGIYAESEEMKFISTIIGIIICLFIWFTSD